MLTFFLKKICAIFPLVERKADCYNGFHKQRVYSVMRKVQYRYQNREMRYLYCRETCNLSEGQRGKRLSWINSYF